MIFVINTKSYIEKCLISLAFYLRQMQGWPAKYPQQINDKVFISAVRHTGNCKTKTRLYVYSWGKFKKPPKSLTMDIQMDAISKCTCKGKWIHAIFIFASMYSIHIGACNFWFMLVVFLVFMGLQIFQRNRSAVLDLRPRLPTFLNIRNSTDLHIHIS